MNLKSNAKDEYRQRRLGLPRSHFQDIKFFTLTSFKVFSLTLTPTISLALGLGLGLTPGKMISVENLKSNAKDENRQRRLEQRP